MGERTKMASQVEKMSNDQLSDQGRREENGGRIGSLDPWVRQMVCIAGPNNIEHSMFHP